MLFSVVNVARHLGLDPESALREAAAKFRDRFQAMEALAASAGACRSTTTSGTRSSSPPGGLVPTDAPARHRVDDSGCARRSGRAGCARQVSSITKRNALRGRGPVWRYV